jgi:hypothetical protein
VEEAAGVEAAVILLRAVASFATETEIATAIDLVVVIFETVPRFAAMTATATGCAETA